MKSTIEPAEDTRETALSAEGAGDGAAPTPRQLVKLSVVIDEADFDRDIDQAFRKIGREATLPGFRAGKVMHRTLRPRRILGRSQAKRGRQQPWLKLRAGRTGQ